MGHRPIMYIHGFGSSGASGKVKQLRSILPGTEIHAPSLSHHPIIDLTVLMETVKLNSIQSVVGSSLGGFYALLLACRFRLRLVLINPSLTPWKTLADQIGTHRIFGSGEKFVWSQESIDELLTMRPALIQALCHTKTIGWADVLVLLSRHDERLDPDSTALLLRKATVLWDEEQGHRFDRLDAYADHIRSVVGAPQP